MKPLHALKKHEWALTLHIGGWSYYQCINCKEKFFWNPRALYTSKVKHDAPCWKQTRYDNNINLAGQPRPMPVVVKMLFEEA